MLPFYNNLYYKAITLENSNLFDDTPLSLFQLESESDII